MIRDYLWLWERSVPVGNCRIWTGATNGKYPIYGTKEKGKTKQNYAHRLALELKLGRPVEEGMDAAHSCHRPLCVNPDHLNERTRSENIRENPMFVDNLCAKGLHEMTSENTAINRNRSGKPPARLCRECKRERERSYGRVR